MIARLAYVVCDRCSMPSGCADDMGENAREARINASRLGWVRVDSEDICPDCA